MQRFGEAKTDGGLDIDLFETVETRSGQGATDGGLDMDVCQVFQMRFEQRTTDGGLVMKVCDAFQTREVRVGSNGAGQFGLEYFPPGLYFFGIMAGPLVNPRDGGPSLLGQQRNVRCTPETDLFGEQSQRLIAVSFGLKNGARLCEIDALSKSHASPRGIFTSRVSARALSRPKGRLRRRARCPGGLALRTENEQLQKVGLLG